MKSNNFNLSISRIKSMVLIKKKTMAALQSEKNIQLSTAFFFQNCVKYRRTKSTLIFILNPPGRCIRTCGRKSSYGIFGRYVLTLLVSVGHLCDLWAGFAEIQNLRTLLVILNWIAEWITRWIVKWIAHESQAPIISDLSYILFGIEELETELSIEVALVGCLVDHHVYKTNVWYNTIQVSFRDREFVISSKF